MAKLLSLRCPRRGVILALLLAALPFFAATIQAQAPSATYRTITGIITDDQHEPLHGVVVELENPATHTVVSYLTASDGRYIFKRVDSHTDFQLWATFRGRKSTIHTISMYDDHLDKVINIICKTY